MKIPKLNKLSTASQLSLLAVVILLGSIFFTVNSALQEQRGSSHASGFTTYSIQPLPTCYFSSGTYKCTTPTASPQQVYPTPTPYSLSGCVWNILTWSCVTPTAVPTRVPTPTQT